MSVLWDKAVVSSSSCCSSHSHSHCVSRARSNGIEGRMSVVSGTKLLRV